MEGYPWTIHKVEVRCPCGISFENADKYLRHKGFCTRHREDTSIGSKPSSAGQRASIAPAKASFTIASQEPRAFCSSKSSKTFRTVQNQSPAYSARGQQMKTNSALSYPGLLQGRTPDAGFMSAAGHPISPPRSANRIDCACGRTFAKQAALDMHLRMSKAHRAEKIFRAEELISLTRNAMQPATQTAPTPSNSPAFAKMPGSIPCSTLSAIRLLRCTCGHSFETQRSLKLHKHDSVYHQRHADDSSTPQAHQEESLTSTLASMSLYSQSAQIQPAAGSLTCVCGCIFSTQGAFDQHSADVARYAWLRDREARGKKFGNPQVGL